MNPLTNVKNITKLNEIELSTGLIHKKSWHDMYKDSAWIFIGGLEFKLTEGDVVTVFSQCGEIVNINLVRDKKTGKSKGFCFLCYANQKSTVLAVDNFNGIKLCNRTIRVDHVANYKPPKEDDRDDEITKILKSEGCAPKHLKINVASSDQAKKKKLKKEKKEKKKKKRKHCSVERDSGNIISSIMDVKVKKEKHDSGYDKYDMPLNKFYNSEGKQKLQERNYEHSIDERSQSHERSRSRSDQFYHIPSKKDNSQNEDKFLKRTSNERSVSESGHKEAYKSRDKDHAKAKRKRSSSSSSSDNFRNPNDRVRYKSEKAQSKHKHSNSDKSLQEHKHSSSSSSDEDSSSQSSTDDEKHRSDSRNSKKDKYRRYEERKSFYEERRDKSDHRRENSNYASSRSGHYDKIEKDFEYQSRGKYKSDERDDNNYRDSYHRSRHDKR